MADPKPTPSEPIASADHAASLGDRCPAASARTIPCTTFWFAFWLGVVLVATKAVHLGMPDFSFSGLTDYLHDLTVISNSDLVFALIVGLVAQCALLCTPSSTGFRRVVYVLLGLFCIVCVVYAVVSVQIFSYLR